MVHFRQCCDSDNNDGGRLSSKCAILSQWSVFAFHRAHSKLFCPFGLQILLFYKDCTCVYMQTYISVFHYFLLIFVVFFTFITKLACPACSGHSGFLPTWTLVALCRFMLPPSVLFLFICYNQLVMLPTELSYCPINP